MYNTEKIDVVDYPISITLDSDTTAEYFDGFVIIKRADHLNKKTTRYRGSRYHDGVLYPLEEKGPRVIGKINLDELKQSERPRITVTRDDMGKYAAVKDKVDVNDATYKGKIGVGSYVEYRTGAFMVRGVVGGIDREYADINGVCSVPLSDCKLLSEDTLLLTDALCAFNVPNELVDKYIHEIDQYGTMSHATYDEIIPYVNKADKRAISNHFGIIYYLYNLKQ